MKTPAISVLLLVSIFGSLSHAGERGLIFLQQETPGHIIYVSLRAHKNIAVVFVEGMGASEISEEGAIPISRFNEIWNLVSSEPFKEFIVPAESGRNMADPKYFTVSMGVNGNIKTYIQIPVSERRGEIGEFIKILKDFIPEES